MIGYAFCGSFCTFADSYKYLSVLKEKYRDIVPIMSFNACNTDTRFGAHEEWIERIEALCGRKIINTITEAEPLGPKISLDALVTEAKLIPLNDTVVAKTDVIVDPYKISSALCKRRISLVNVVKTFS